MKTDLHSILDRPIAFHRCLVEPAGSVDAALMLSQALYWTKRATLPDGWFYKSQKEWEEETGLSRSEQECARRSLSRTDFWQEKLRRVPATLHFRVDCRILQTRLLESHKLECTTLQTRSRNPANITSSETTAETTSKTKSPLPPAGAGEELTFDHYGRTIGFRMGRHRRPPSLKGTAGAHAEDIVSMLNSKGYPARIIEAA